MATNFNSNRFLSLLCRAEAMRFDIACPLLGQISTEWIRIHPMQLAMWLNNIYFSLEHFWMHSFSFSRVWCNMTLIKADVPSGDALILSTWNTQSWAKILSRMSMIRIFFLFFASFSAGLSLTNHFTADLGREWRLVTKATEVLLTAWPMEKPRTAVETHRVCLNAAERTSTK